ncbi:FitA-like ribbon-helix-helix domain-containing protein [Mycolicibacter icosiumassiliensis]|uniref:FitA-like ribbon-helix-helix domain-containing protein n=1 Tax=Mycolicibacter icosiumassiliensis TaxID=1792835 RepID=UPI00082E7C87|nr:plasmid stabilization protein [Mycolicibacter icosiumassiliensis]
MAAISVRDLDERVAARLKMRAAQHGRSMEAEVRAILTHAVAESEHDRPNLAQAIRERFGAIGGVDLEIPPHAEMPRVTEFPE